MMVLLVLSMTDAKGPRPDGMDESPLGKRFGPPPQTK